MFLAAFWPYSGKEPKNAAEQQKPPAASVKLTNTTARVVSVVETHAGAFDMDETGAGRLCTIWQHFFYQKVNQTCTTWWQILYQIRRTEEGKARRAAFLVV